MVLAADSVANPLEGKVVEIRIEGNNRVESDTIKSYLETEVGDTYYPARVRQDIKNIYAQGFFRDVEVFGRQTGQGVVLTYRVVERPMVSKVSYSGNKAATDDEMKEAITVEEHRVLDENQVKETEKAIKSLYEKKGFYLVEVESDIEPKGKGKVEVSFKVEENEKVRIKRVIFLGNKNFEDEELLKAVSTRPEGALSFLTKSGTFIDREFENDSYRLKYFYLDHGYIEISIEDPQAFLSPDKKDVTVVYHLREGPQYFIRNIDIKGDLIKEKEELLSRLKLKPGAVFSRGDLQGDIETLSRIYADEGYADANVVPRPRVIKEKTRVDLTLYIQKGRKIYIERIDITGNGKTRDKVIRRQMKITEGELYSASAIEKSERNIKRLGFFKSVKIVPSQGSGPALRKLNVIVEERPTGSISAGAGYSTTEDFMFNAQIRQENFFGRGQGLSASLNYGKNTQSGMVSFSDPYVFDSRFSTTLTGRLQYRSYLSFDRKDIGGSFTVGRLLPRSESSRIYLTYQFQKTELSGFESAYAVLNRIPLDSTTSSITLSFRKNTTNNYLDPSRGSYLRLSCEYAGRILGGENDFNKYELEYRRYLPVFWKTYLAFRGETGLLDHDQGRRLLITERYFLGGIYDLRGFDTRSIGPVYPSDNPHYSGVTIGGNKQVVLSLDYVIPISEQLGFKGVIFFDAGNAFNDDEPIDPAEFRTDWGVGIRWISPMGPLRFELGFPIDRKSGEDPQVFQFAIGTPLQ